MENALEQSYGPHLTIDAYGCTRERLADLEVVYDFLDKLPGIIGMEKITKPYVFKHKESPDLEWGITGVVIIATSHISVHTYPARGVAFADVFSCRDFDTKRALSVFEDVFGAQKMDVHEVKRGLLFHECNGGEW